MTRPYSTSLAALLLLTAGPSALAQLEWTEVTGATAPAPRYGHAMARNHPSFVPMLFGGTDGQTVFGDTWFRSNGAWILRATTGPSPRHDHTMIPYHFTNDSMLLFGGADEQGKRLGDTWVWNGVGWIMLSPSVAPTARTGHAMAKDEWEIQTSILFGGRTDDGISDETWRFVNGQWSPVSTTTRPPAREGHSLVQVGGIAFSSPVFVLYGGHDDERVFSDVWTFDGTDWREIRGAGAVVPRTGHVAVLEDLWRARPLVFGGAATKVHQDTREMIWNGAWVTHETIGQPTPRQDAAIALEWNSFKSRYLMFGGRDASGAVLGDTWVLEPVTTPKKELVGEGCGVGAWSLTGGPDLFSPSQALLGNFVEVDVLSSQSSRAVFFIGAENGPFAPQGCGLQIQPTHIEAARMIDVGGAGFLFTATTRFVLPFEPALLGTTIAVQATTTDSTVPGGIGFSRVMRITPAE